MDQPRKVGAVVPISRELAMDYGLLPDTRPPHPRLRWRTRLRWWWHDRVHDARHALADRIDPGCSWSEED